MNKTARVKKWSIQIAEKCLDKHVYHFISRAHLRFERADVNSMLHMLSSILAKATPSVCQ